jgi:hypothetical protein
MNNYKFQNEKWNSHVSLLLPLVPSRIAVCRRQDSIMSLEDALEVRLSEFAAVVG